MYIYTILYTTVIRKQDPVLTKFGNPNWINLLKTILMFQTQSRCPLHHIFPTWPVQTLSFIATDWNLECLRKDRGKSGGLPKPEKGHLKRSSRGSHFSAYLCRYTGKMKIQRSKGVSYRMSSQMISNCDASISKIWENMSMYSICIFPVFARQNHMFPMHIDSSLYIYAYVI